MNKELYLFIIWSNARWCEKRIIQDLTKEFKIIFNEITSWKKEEFIKGLQSFYGAKLLYPDEKVNHCGNGEFRVIVVEDENPIFENRITSAGVEKVNSKIFDKKTLYRKWTGGGHRIHCSNSSVETNHDLTILFGNEWIQFIRNCDGGIGELKLFSPNTQKDFEDRISNLGGNIYLENNEKCLILSKNRHNTLFSVYITDERVGPYRMIKGTNVKEFYVLGQDEGDIPQGVVEQYCDDVNGLSKFDLFNLCSTEKIKTIKEVFKKEGFKTDSVGCSPKYRRQNVYDRFRDNYKLLLCKFKYGDK